MLEDGVVVLCLWTQYQSSSGYYIGNAQITEPTAVTTSTKTHVLLQTVPPLTDT
jgi:hypothetical protein